MTKTQLFAAVGGIGDDLVTRATENQITQASDDSSSRTLRTRSRKTRRRITAAVAACLLVAVVGAIFVQIDLNYFTAACGGSPGTLVNGIYYYYDRNAGYFAYDPATGKSELLVSELFHDLERGGVNAYGFYYTAIDSHYLKVRVHETGETVTLYEASFDEWTHTLIDELYEDTLIYTLFNRDEHYRTVLLLDARSGDVLETMVDRAPYGEEDYFIPYRVGDRVLSQHFAASKNHDPTAYGLFENGEPLVMAGSYVSLGGLYGVNNYAGDSLIVHTTATSTSREQYHLLRPNGETVTVQDHFAVFGGTNDYLFGHLEGQEFPLDTLYAYDIATGETFVLIDNYQMQEITTDGTYLYATAPWGRATEVYRLDYTADGTLIGATWIDTIE